MTYSPQRGKIRHWPRRVIQWHKLKWSNFWRYTSELFATIKESDRKKINRILFAENLDSYNLVDGVEAMHSRLNDSRSECEKLAEVVTAVAGIRRQPTRNSVQIENCITYAREALGEDK